ncbi:hypothetical protein [Listeria cornellensis]|uniref:DUF4190 domain-containing protein n=1 Tax=Listeria cornellensis FSL F6-0969 TaxID=1265820 RepID=W7BGZ7_9LIST|nr:hypothetical protein [Listeria cornellensis]EUJ26334.1 hypothetical protein PCORN_15156 [Listeria cornellensis FSL F6-0969]
MTKTNNETLMLVLSIVSFFIPFGTVLAIWSLVASVKARKIEKNSMNTATLILSILSLIYTVVALILIGIGLLAFFNDPSGVTTIQIN